MEEDHGNTIEPSSKRKYAANSTLFDPPSPRREGCYVDTALPRFTLSKTASPSIVTCAGIHCSTLRVIAPYGPISGSIEIGAGVIVLALLVWMISICIDYRYNICLLTSHRIIEIKRSHLLIREKRTETEYDNIREVRVHIANLFERLFRIGTVDIDAEYFARHPFRPCRSPL